MPDWRYYPIDEIPAGLSLGEWICQDFTRYLNLLCMRKQCFFLPVELQRLRMQDVGGRHEFVTRFAPTTLSWVSAGQARPPW
jgi:hypothetical protein